MFSILKSIHMMDLLYVYLGFFCSKTCIERALGNFHFLYSKKLMKNWERIGHPSYIRPSGRPICVGVVWPHSPFPSAIPRRDERMRRGFEGSSGYSVRFRHCKSQFLMKKKRDPEEFGMGPEGIRANQALRILSCIWKPLTSLSLFSPAAQLKFKGVHGWLLTSCGHKEQECNLSFFGPRKYHFPQNKT